MNDICLINNNTINLECNDILKRNDWITLWETKNDYFEAQISEIGKRFPDLCNTVNYYIGLAENAVSFVRNVLNIDDYVYTSISHKRIDDCDTLYCLYNPLNLLQ